LIILRDVERELSGGGENKRNARKGKEEAAMKGRTIELTVGIFAGKRRIKTIDLEHAF